MSNPIFSGKNSPFNNENNNQVHNPFTGQMEPQATPGAMTINGSIQKTGILFGIVILAAAIGWFLIPMSLALPLSLIAFVAGLAIVFKKNISKPLIFTYAGLMGLMVGSLSMAMESYLPGVVSQAVLATFAVFAAVLLLFLNGKIRSSPKITKFFMVAMVAYLLFSLVNIGMMLLGVPMAGGMFGMYSQEIAGIPIGLILGPIVILMGAYSLLLDFEFIKDGTANQLPEKYEWMAAHGIIATMLWLYLEILRFLAILGSNR